MKRYEVIKDLQGGDFGMGRQYTALEWLDQAVEWRDSDDSWGDWGEGTDCYGTKHHDEREWFIDFWKHMIADGKEQKLLDYIADMWQIEFAEVKNPTMIDEKNIEIKEDLVGYIGEVLDSATTMKRQRECLEEAENLRKQLVALEPEFRSMNLFDIYEELIRRK